MILTRETHRLQTLDQVQAFLDGSAALTLAVAERSAAYAWMAETLRRFGYARLHRQACGLLLRYLAKVSGPSRQQVTRLVAQWRASRRITVRHGATDQRQRGTVTKARPVQATIGERRPPTPYGRPG
jgi:hypothetical protein